MSAFHLLELNELSDTTLTGPSLVETINPLHQVKATLQVCVGEVALTVGDLLNAKERQVLTLDRQVDQPVDLILGGKVVARGQLVAVGDNFAVRISELSAALKA